MKRLLLLTLLSLGIANAAQLPKQPEFTTQIEAIKSTEKITIDAQLSEAIWKRPGVTGLIQQEPIQGVNPTQRSEVWLAYDDDAIYFAANYYDNNPDSILARLVRRDFIWGDPSDGCVLYLDSYGDKRNGYFFYVSAAGAKADGLIENDVKQPNDLTWDAVWDGVAKINEDGWSVEMKIPFSQLRFKPGTSQRWGVNVERFISRTAETAMLAYTPRNESGFTSRFPELHGIEGIKPADRLEILPYITGKAEYIGNDPGDPFNSGREYSPGAGLDVRAGLGNSLTLNATINPDFGQVELDPAVVNLTDVESVFEEKRPFFTEGVNIFRFGRGGLNNNWNFNWNNPAIFYSRRIGRTPQGSLPSYDYADIPNGTHILGAAKISGSIGGNWKVGTIHALTRREYADLDLGGERSSIEIEPLTYYGVVRAQRDYNNGKQGIGILSTFTNRFYKNNDLQNSISRNALVTAVDGWTFLDGEGTYVLNGWGALSRVTGSTDRMIALQRGAGHYFQRPDVTHIKIDSSATSLTGYGGRLMMNKNRGPVVLNAAVGVLSPEFEINDLGFNSFSDFINTHIVTGYRWNQPTSFYQNTGFNVGAFSTFDFGGNRTATGFYLGGYWNTPSLYGANASFTYNPESYSARRTRGGPLTLNPVSRSFNIDAYTDMRRWWVLQGGVYHRTGEDAASNSFYTGLEFKVSTTLTMQIQPELTFDKLHAQWVTSIRDNTASATYGRRYIFANLDQTTFSTNIRADWIISPKLSMQVYLQPLIASGKYDEFKELRAPKTFDFLEYGEESSTLVKSTNENGNTSYTLDADGDGPAAQTTIGNPDFNYLSLRGSAVLRWEYLPGSTLFLVWTQSREDFQSHGIFHFSESMDSMFKVKPDNIFMLKISYWL